MPHSRLTALVRQGLAALDCGNTLLALPCFEEAARLTEAGTVLSCLGYCLARERRDLEQGLTLCREALRREPANPLHYLNLGRIYLLAHKKAHAMAAFRRGLEFGAYPALQAQVERLGRRRRPLFPRLGRKHFLNRYAGFFLSRLGVR